MRREKQPQCKGSNRVAKDPAGGEAACPVCGRPDIRIYIRNGRNGRRAAFLLSEHKPKPFIPIAKGTIEEWTKAVQAWPTNKQSEEIGHVEKERDSA